MELLVSTISKEKETLNKNNIRLLAIGDLKSLPPKCYRELQDVIDDTSKNSRMSLVLALSYSAKWELTEALRQIAGKVSRNELAPSSITEQIIAQHLW